MRYNYPRREYEAGAVHMAEKDVTEKILESYNDVFADIVNVLLFNGQSVIQPDELIDQAPRSAYKVDGRRYYSAPWGC